MYLDLTLPQFWDTVNSLTVHTLINYYFLVYVFTNLATRALNFEFNTTALELGHKFMFTLILVSVFHFLFSRVVFFSKEVELSTLLIQTALLFIVIAWLIGKWLISSDGLLRFLSTRFLLRNKRKTQESLQKN